MRNSGLPPLRSYSWSMSASLVAAPNTARRDAPPRHVQRVERHADGDRVIDRRRPVEVGVLALRGDDSTGRSASERATRWSNSMISTSAHWRSSIHSTTGPDFVRRRIPRRCSENSISRDCAGATRSSPDGYPSGGVSPRRNDRAGHRRRRSRTARPLGPEDLTELVGRHANPRVRAGGTARWRSATRRCSRRRGAHAGEDRDARLGKSSSASDDQAGLARSGLAADRHDGTAPVGDHRHHRRQQLPLGRPADEGVVVAAPAWGRCDARPVTRHTRSGCSRPRTSTSRRVRARSRPTPATAVESPINTPPGGASVCSEPRR
jgi:hypothetical protein